MIKCNYLNNIYIQIILNINLQYQVYLFQFNNLIMTIKHNKLIKYFNYLFYIKIISISLQ